MWLRTLFYSVWLVPSVIGVSLGFLMISVAEASSLEVGEREPLSPAQLTDNITGKVYHLNVIADTENSPSGFGQITLLLKEVPETFLSICSIHAPPADIDFGTIIEPPILPAPGYGGIKPLSEFECGTAFAFRGSINECTAKIEFHGFGHSDPPYVNYAGPITADFEFQKLGPNEGAARITMYTPKQEVTVFGKVTGTIIMDTCP
jgi:hypothetical protein